MKYECDTCENISSCVCPACMEGTVEWFKAYKKRKNAQIRKLKREIRYHIGCRTGDIEYMKGGKALMKEFDKVYQYL